MKLYVLVENYGLINEDVHVFLNSEEADAKYKELTGVDYDRAQAILREELEVEEFPSSLDSKEYEQTKIFEVEIESQMKVCEHEDLRCPYCGSMKEPAEVENVTIMKVRIINIAHQVVCSECHGIFWVTCED